MKQNQSSLEISWNITAFTTGLEMCIRDSIETVHSHTLAVELAAKLLENGISTPDQLLTRLQVEKASFHNEDKIKIIKDGQSSKATYYNHIPTLFSLYTLSLKQQDIMCNLCFLPSTGISARIFAKWLEPVSYTHLDVYKRQTVICFAFDILHVTSEKCDISIRILQSSAFRLDTIHLDVYKRQS